MCSLIFIRETFQKMQTQINKNTSHTFIDLFYVLVKTSKITQLNILIEVTFLSPLRCSYLSVVTVTPRSPFHLILMKCIAL